MITTKCIISIENKSLKSIKQIGIMMDDISL